MSGSGRRRIGVVEDEAKIFISGKGVGFGGGYLVLAGKSFSGEHVAIAVGSGPANDGAHGSKTGKGFAVFGGDFTGKAAIGVAIDDGFMFADLQADFSLGEVLADLGVDGFEDVFGEFANRAAGFTA